METKILSPELFTQNGWEINQETPYHTVVRKVGKRYKSQYTNVMFVGFSNDRITVFYYEEERNHRVDFTLPAPITIEEFNTLLNIVKLTDFKIK